MSVELTDDYVFAYSGQNVFLTGGSKEEQQIIGRKTRSYPYNPAGMLKGNFIDINAVMHRKSLIEEVGMFDESLRTLEDYDLFARIVAKYPFNVKQVDQILGEYYFFLKETADTVENSILSNDWLMRHFNVGGDQGDEKIVKDRLRELLHKNDK